MDAAGPDVDRRSDADLDIALGRAIRTRRLAKGISLRDLAARAELSPSFVSQLERGLARPRITSLHRVARMLDTTAQALLSTGEAGTHSLVRHQEDREVDQEDRSSSDKVRSLVRGDRSITAMEFRGLPLEFGSFYEHPGEELYIVAGGVVEVELGGEIIVLESGDCLCFDGRTPHRSRRVGDTPTNVYVVTSREDVQ